MQYIKYLITLTLILFFLTCKSQKNANAKEYYLQGEAYYAQGKSKKAYKYYYKAACLDKKPDYYVKAAAAYYTGFNISKREHYNKVLDLFNEALGLSAWDTNALYTRAKFFEYNAEYDKSIRDLDFIIDKYPKYFDSYILKAQILMGKKDTANAFKAYNNCLLNVSKNHYSEIFHEIGFNCYLRGYWKAGINAYNEELKLVGESKFFSYCPLSSCYFNIGMTDSACYYMKKCDINKYPTLTSKELILNSCKLLK